MYKLEFKKSAVKEAKKLSTPVWNRIREQILDLQNSPTSQNSKPLRGYKGYFRIRIGDYRVVYFVNKDKSMVTIFKIGHRKDVYRDF